MDTKALFPAIARLSETGAGLREALGEMADALYKSPKIYGLRDEDDVSELFARYPGRIETILRKYQDASGYFPAYLVATVRYLALTLHRDRARAYDRKAVFDADTLFCAEDVGRPDILGEHQRSILPEASGKGRYHRQSLEARFVFLSLKCAWTVDDESLAGAAAALGVDPGDLILRLAEARQRTYFLQDRWKTRQAARDASWVRLRVLERRLAREDDPCAQVIYRERIAREKERFRKRLAQMRNVRLTLPNRAVAEVLGIPKGTVDAGLFHLARRLRDFQSREENQ
jgi:hypothetical protein